MSARVAILVATAPAQMLPELTNASATKDSIKVTNIHAKVSDAVEKVKKLVQKFPKKVKKLHWPTAPSLHDFVTANSGQLLWPSAAVAFIVPKCKFASSTMPPHCLHVSGRPVQVLILWRNVSS